MDDNCCGCASCQTQKDNSTVKLPQKRLSKDLLLLIAAMVLYAAALAVKIESIRLFLFAAAYFTSGAKVLYYGAKSLMRGGVFDEFVLMSIATLGAIAIGQYSEAVAVMIFYCVGEFLSERAVNKSRAQIAALSNIRPDTAYKIIDGNLEMQDPSTIGTGEQIVIRAGDRVPIDCIVIEGSGFIDNSALTGESQPVFAEAGTKLLSGSINISSQLVCETTALYKDSAASRIIELAENAAAKKAKTELFITKFSKVYTPVVVCSAALLAFIPPLFAGDFNVWFYRALTFLVVSCPCALVLSVPLGFFAGIGAASKHGILFKGGGAVESHANVKCAVFDKTGTLTKGRFSVNYVKTAEQVTKGQLLALAAGVEKGSTHPLAQAIIDYAVQCGAETAQVADIAERAGFGVVGSHDGMQLLAGNKRLMEEYNITIPVSSEGTAVHIALNGKYLGTIEAEDIVKEDAAKTVKQLKALGMKNIAMLSGDRSEVCGKVARELMIEDVRCRLLPEDKVTQIEKIQSDFGPAVFVGDGINDAPVLATASVGAAMGRTGSDAAVEAADVIIMGDDLTKIPLSIRHAKRSVTVIRQNVIGAVAVKFLVLILAAFGIASMWLAIFADVGVSLIAVANSLRLLKLKR